jgi:hypothetical protein
MKTYKDIDNKLKEELLKNVNIDCFEKHEIDLIEVFTTSVERNKKFKQDQFGDRIMKRDYLLFSILEYFFFKSRFIEFVKTDTFIIKIAGLKEYEEFKIVMNEPVYLISNNGNIEYISSVKRCIVDYLNKEHNLSINQGLDYVLSTDKLSTEEAIIMIPKNFKFKISDVSFLNSGRPTNRYLKYLNFDEILMCPAEFIENNDVNKKQILQMIKKHGIGLNIFVKGLKYNNYEVEKYIIPSIKKTTNSLSTIYSKEKIFVRFIETQSHLDDDILINFISQLNYNKIFMKKIKNSKRIKTIYSNRPTMLLFMMII